MLDAGGWWLVAGGYESETVQTQLSQAEKKILPFK
jgi:hypothetical protein